MSGTWFPGMKGYFFKTWAARTVHKATWSLPKRLCIFKLPTLSGIQFPAIKVNIFLYKTTISFTNFPTMSGTWFPGMKGYLFKTWAALTVHKETWSLPKKASHFQITYIARNSVPNNEG